MSTAESNENSAILALIEQNSSLQKSLVDIIQARDANEAERRVTNQMLDQQDSQRLADEAKAHGDYLKSLVPVLVPVLMPLVQSLLKPPTSFDFSFRAAPVKAAPDSEKH